MSDITIYHNPNCGTSRNVLAMIKQSGATPTIIEYIQNPPGREKLVSLVRAMDIPVRDLLRKKGTPFDELGLEDTKWSDDALIDFIMQHPILMNRPVVETPIGTRLCRPSEVILEILPNQDIGSFAKEDGEVVTAGKGTKK